MPRKGHREEQIVFALRQVENGAMVPEVLPKARRERADLLPVESGLRGAWVLRAAVTEAARDENNRLKRLVADLSLDKHILQEVLSKKV